MKFTSTFIKALCAVQESPVADGGVDIEFDPKGFLDMLPYMGKGMLVIFAIIAIIAVATILINKFFSKKEK